MRVTAPMHDGFSGGPVFDSTGGVIGIAGAVAASRGAGALLHQLQGSDPGVLTLSAVVLAVVALTAGFVPALRASRIDPMRALRWE